MSVVAAVTAVVGLAVSVDAKNDAKRAAKEKGKVLNASQKIEDASNLRKQAREARIQRSRILQASEEAGGGSRETGSISSSKHTIKCQQV